MRRRMGSLVVAWAWAWSTILLGGTRTKVGATCLLPSMLIETTNGGLSISGCYRETVYLGLYQTTVWTIEGQDIADTGTAAIVADLGGSVTTDPVWTIGIVALLPANTWSDGYGAGIDLRSTACLGDSPFWENEDPTEETVWKCDTNQDGVVTVAESGDFATITCGCPDENGVLETAPPTPTSVTSSVGNPTPRTAPPVDAPTTPGNTEPTLPPLPISQPRIPAAGVTPAPSAPSTPLTPATPSTPSTPLPPSSGVDLVPEALACNITIISETLRDLSGCYAGRVSSTSKGTWVQLDESSRIEWQETDGPDEGYWAIIVNGFGLPDTEKCFSESDESDPTKIHYSRWFCDSDGDGEAGAIERGDFTGLECSDVCLSTTATAAAGESSSGGVDSETAIIAGGVVASIIVVGLFAIAAILLLRRKKRVEGEVVEPIDGEAASEAAPPPPAIPVFEPWGSRPPPKYFGSS